jgi:hypothetical protein
MTEAQHAHSTGGASRDDEGLLPISDRTGRRSDRETRKASGISRSRSRVVYGGTRPSS